MSRPATSDRNVKIEQRREVGLARISTEGVLTSCACGWGKIHARDKVRDNAAEKHVARQHGGRAIWL